MTITHGDPSRNKIDLVQDIHQMLVCLFLPQILHDGLTPCSERISGVQDMDDHI